MPGEEREEVNPFLFKMPICLALTVLIVDQATKFLASRLLLLNRPLPVIDKFFSLTLVHNRGAAFGVFKGQVYIFVFFSLAAVGLIYRSIKRQNKNSLYTFSLGLLLGGAIGNLIDRITLGYVVDFLDFHVWPVFNIADSAISVGAVLLGWLAIKGGKR